MIHNDLYKSWCIWYFKDTNSKANHNIKVSFVKVLMGVFGISKIQIQKQITTQSLLSHDGNRCIWYFKDTNSKANHNGARYGLDV